MWKFINKLRNASRFTLSQVDPKLIKKLDYDKLSAQVVKSQKKMNDFDKRIFTKTQDLILQVDKYNEKFMVGESVQEIITVVWHDFCDRYIEISKLQKSEVTEKLLLYCLGTYIKLLHPSMPHCTERLRGHLGYQ